MGWGSVQIFTLAILLAIAVVGCNSLPISISMLYTPTSPPPSPTVTATKRPPTPTPVYRTYKVKRGDTLSGIAQKFHVSLKALLDLLVFA
jgi:LysM repeat protein